MALRDTARLLASLELEDKFSRPADKIDASAGKLEGRFSKLDSGARKIGGGMGHAAGSIAKVGAVAGAVAIGGGIALLTKAFTSGTASLEELQQVSGRTDAVLKSTGGIAGQTSASIRKLAEEFENLSTNDDKAIQNAENLLLTFTGIGPKAFKPATQAILDLNAAMGGGDEGLAGTAIQVGKALNDPLKGVTALSRVGVSFTAQQIKQIKTLQAANDTFGAQQIILAELNKEFGGQAKVFGTGPAAEARRLADAEEGLSVAFAQKLQPAVVNVRRALTGALANPEVIAGIERLGTGIAGVFTADRVTTGVNRLADGFGRLFSQENLDRASGIADRAFGALKNVDFGAIAGGLKITADATKGIVNAFLSLPPDLQKIAVAALAANKLTGGLVTSGIKDVVGGLAGLALGSLKTITAGNVTVVGANVTGVGGPGGGPGLVTQAAGAVAGLGAAGIASVAIAGIAPVALFGLTEAIINATGKPIAQRDVEGRQAVANARNPTGQAPPVPQTRPGVGNTAGDWFARHGQNLTDALKGVSAADDRHEGALNAMARDLPAKTAFAITRFTSAFIQAIHEGNRVDVKTAHAAAREAEGGVGNARNTGRLLDALRRLRANTHDRATVKLLDGDIRRISAIAEHRRFVAQQLARADRIARGTGSLGDKITDLKAIERNLGSRNRVALEHVRTEVARLQGGANKTANAIDRSRVHLASKIEDAGATTAAASRGTTRTIQQKSFTAQVTVPVTTVIDGRTFRSTLTRTSQSSRYGSSVT
jgi:hypothetical protein